MSQRFEDSARCPCSQEDIAEIRPFQASCFGYLIQNRSFIAIRRTDIVHIMVVNALEP
jgi:hypothetical protein